MEPGELEERKAAFRMKKTGVLMGGTSGEREISLKTGGAVLKALQSRDYRAMLIDADNDVARRLKTEGVEVAFIALHGGWGEDGSVQGMLEVMGIPYTGSGVLASAVAMDKVATKKFLYYHDIPTPPFRLVRAGGKAAQPPPMPVIVKPPSEGSTLGVSVVKDPVAYDAALREAFRYGDTAMVESFIEGRELTVSILGERVLPIVEIIPKEGIYNYQAKYTKGMTEFVVPAKLDKKVEGRVKAVALDAYTALGCSGAARVDMVMNKDEKPYVLELNTVPGMTEMSLLPMAAGSVGIGYAALIEEILLGAPVGTA
ncbi:MAG: D-alanine--D-alanine ligase [Thermodesulfobacteriota bacterium]